MKLSIIVPIFNSEIFLDRCIESILNQNFKEMEILLINDGSTDKSIKVCRKYENKDKRIIVYDNENKGCSFSRNFGIEMSKGQYITFVDSDDSYVENQFLDKVIKLMEIDNLDLLVFGYNKINVSGEIKIELPQEAREKKSLYKQKIFFNNPVNKIYRRDLIIKNSIVFPLGCHMGEDMAFNFKYSQFINKLRIINKSFYNYFENINSASFSVEKRLDIFKTFDDIIDFFKFNKIELPIQNLKSYYDFHAIKSPYIFLANLLSEKKIDKLTVNLFVKLIEDEQKKRRNIFNNNFLFSKFYGKMRIKFYFIFNILKKIKLKGLKR